MKYTDQFFRFPIRIYDALSMKKAMKMEEDMDIPQEAEYSIGFAKIPYWELDRMYYYDVFTKGRSVGEVDSDGFDAVAIHHESYGEFECLWKMKTFEEKLNDFMEKINNYLLETFPMENMQVHTNGVCGDEKDLII